MISSYVGENAEFERQYLSGELEVELTPQVIVIFLLLKDIITKARRKEQRRCHSVQCFVQLCFATPLHDTLHSVTYLATIENVARQVAETIAKSTTRFYFLQRFQATFRFVAQSKEPVAKCERLCNVSCKTSCTKKLHSVTAP